MAVFHPYRCMICVAVFKKQRFWFFFFKYQFWIHNHLTAFPSGLCKPEDIIELHPQRLNSTSSQEVVDHPRAWGGDIKGSVCAESQPLPGVPLWRPSADSVQGQCLPSTEDCKPWSGSVCVIATLSSDYTQPIFCVGVQRAQRIPLQRLPPHAGACCAYLTKPLDEQSVHSRWMEAGCRVKIATFNYSS